MGLTTAKQIQHRLKSNLVGRSSRLALMHLGCSLVELQRHLEAQFRDGMSWDNYGTHGWQVDHIVPLRSTTDYYARLKLHHYTNLQPLWAQRNQRKGPRQVWTDHGPDTDVARAIIIETLRLHTGEGQPFSSNAARRHGCSSALLSYYAKRGTLLRLGRGAFMFPGDKLDLAYAISFLGGIIPDLHIGSESAIRWHENRDFAASGQRLVLVTQSRKTLPQWFTERFHCSVVRRTPFPVGSSLYLENLHSQDAELKGAKVASRELAVIEVINEVGWRVKVDHACEVLSRVRQMDAAGLVRLLEASNRVKVRKFCAKLLRDLDTPWTKDLAKLWNPILSPTRWSGKYADGSTLELGRNLGTKKRRR